MKSKILSVTLASSIVSSTVAKNPTNEVVNDAPIIGIFGQPKSSNITECGGSCQYIAASYVKYFESSGARVVPIDYYSTHSDIDFLFPKLNGFFFPGGGATFPDSAQYVFDKTVEANEAGDYMPLWGTCMGFQWLLISATEDVNVLDPKSGQMDSYNISMNLEFTADASGSKLFHDASPHVMNVLATENVTMNNHHYGIYYEHFKQTDALTSFFDVLSTNHDGYGDEFVSTIESKKYPIYGTQWHPEKNAFEWARNEDGTFYEAINHSNNAVEIAQYTSSFFVHETKKNNHMFDSEEQEDSYLIYNYKPVKTSGDFVQTYFLFPEK